jgi:glycerol-3-phosphate acyltransferase PlsY
MWSWLLVPFAYALGSLSSAIIVCRMLGLPDPREEGSKNPGATNVLRFGGKKAAAVTLAGDVLKGLVPVALAVLLGLAPALIAAVGLAAFLGHLYPVFFGFQGGKGVATGLGVFTGLSWQVGLALGITWLAVARLLRISSLSALIAAVLAPIYVWWLTGVPEFILAACFISALSIWRHRSNIRRLLAGDERTIGR